MTPLHYAPPRPAIIRLYAPPGRHRRTVRVLWYRLVGGQLRGLRERQRWCERMNRKDGRR